jgi:hypothetical protein
MDASLLKTMLLLSCFLICICWAIGAYNRLVRLRSAAKNASSVAQYNQAIQEFPTSVLAAVFVFKPLPADGNILP